MAERLPVRDALISFAADEPLHAALFLSYAFDGRWFEEAIVPDLFEHDIATALVVRDRNAIVSEAPSVRYRKANACTSAVFHPKLVLLVAEDKARAVISSANLTRCAFEKQKELGRVFDLGPKNLADHHLFSSLADYLENGVCQDVCGDSARELKDVTQALRSVVTRYAPTPSPTSDTHILLHNYAAPIWDQLLMHVPHRVLRRAVIVSPFFEPDRKHPEDPVLRPQDDSIFACLLENFEFHSPKDDFPIHVFFRQNNGCTELPVQKLAATCRRIAFYAQDEREQRLHAKLLLLEGEGGPGREPFLLALHGSPNFTAAGLLGRPPGGNSELAILTTLPARPKAMDRTIVVLGLEQGFTRIADLGSLKTQQAGEAPVPPSQGVADVTYRVADEVVTLSLRKATPPGAQVRLMLLRDGAWIVVGKAAASAITQVDIGVTGVARLDPGTSLLELLGTTLRVEIIGPDGGVLSSDLTPLNVDVPEQFCGLTLVEPAYLTLDERIARAGFGLRPTYREQQNWLEARRAHDQAQTRPGVLTHQADLDRFFRNVHQGLRCFLNRTKDRPGSEVTLRRSMNELCRWAVEAATSDARELTRECRLYLIDRLLRTAQAIVGQCAQPTRIQAIAADLRLADRLCEVNRWLGGIREPALDEYALGSRKRACELLRAFRKRS